MKLGTKSKRNESFPLKPKWNESFWLKATSESKGGLKWTPLKTRVILQSIRKIGMAEIQMELNALPPLQRLKEMCINISMSIIEKVLHYEENKLLVIKFKDEIWFKAKQVALLLGYLDPCRSIGQNVDPEDRISLEKLIGKGGGVIRPPFSFELPRLYALFE